MFFVLRLLTLFLACLGLALPAAVSAETRTERVTIHVNVHLPTGTAVIGTIVLDRTCGAVEIRWTQCQAQPSGQFSVGVPPVTPLKCLTVGSAHE